MLFNNHLNLVGQHAFLSASVYHWINYTDEKLDARFITAMAAQRGTELHELAKNAIKLGVKVQSPKNIKNYVNDAIGYRMLPEQVLYYSDNCFGTTDAISFRRNKLRLHDLKTGVTPASEHQLEVYAALFCLEYRYKPFDIEIELRIYQSDEVQIFTPVPDAIFHIMDKIISFDKRIEALKTEAMS